MNTNTKQLNSSKLNGLLQEVFELDWPPIKNKIEEELNKLNTNPDQDPQETLRIIQLNLNYLNEQIEEAAKLAK